MKALLEGSSVSALMNVRCGLNLKPSLLIGPRKRNCDSCSMTFIGLSNILKCFFALIRLFYVIIPRIRSATRPAYRPKLSERKFVFTLSVSSPPDFPALTPSPSLVRVEYPMPIPKHFCSADPSDRLIWHLPLTSKAEFG